MKKNITILFGIVVLVFTLGLNYRHAANDYGILENTLSMPVLAQTSTDGSYSDWLGLWDHQQTQDPCVLSVSETSTITTPIYVKSTTMSWTLSGHYYKCVPGWAMVSCIKTCKPD